MLRKAARLLIALLILLELGIMAISTMPTRTTTVNAALETDMPVVFVDPPETVANVGDTVAISVKVFNLSGDFYPTNEAWEEGDPLPPLAATDWRYNYSLGHLYALDLRLSWDPTILEYVNHTAMVPDDDHPGGILNGPDVIMVTDTADKDAGTYTLSVSSQAPAAAFNAPDANATAFTMNFTVKKAGKCDIALTNIDLVVDLVGLGFPFSVPSEAPHWTRHGMFRTGNLLTRIESANAGSLVAGSLHDPVLHGENTTVSISMKNDNDTVTDTFNLSLNEGTTLLREWENEELDPDTVKIFNHTIEGLDVGLHTLTVEASILHGSDIRTDELQKSFTVVGTPNLQISGPDSASAGQTVSFSASSSVHSDPNGIITTYTWTLWAIGETARRDTKTGQSVDFQLPPETERVGNWTVMLVVTDNYGITARAPQPDPEKSRPPLTPTMPASELERPATAAYRKTAILNVQAAAPPGLNIEWILLIVILVVIIALAVFYMRRRSR